jgi:transposase-like protein
LYRAINKGGATVDFLFWPTRKDAKRFFPQAYARHGLPVQVTIDGSQTNLDAARKCHAEVRMRNRPDTKPLKVRKSRYMNNRIE